MRFDIHFFHFFNLHILSEKVFLVVPKQSENSVLIHLNTEYTHKAFGDSLLTLLGKLESFTEFCSQQMTASFEIQFPSMQKLYSICFGKCSVFMPGAACGIFGYRLTKGTLEDWKLAEDIMHVYLGAFHQNE